ARPVVILERLLVLPFRLRVRLDRLLELLHVVRERDQVVVRGGLHLRQLGLPPAAAMGDADGEEPQAAEDEQADQDAGAGSPPAGRAGRSAAVESRGAKAVDEVDQGRGGALAAMRVQRFGCELAGDAVREHAVAAGAEVPADDDGIRSATAQAVVDRLQDAVWIAAGLVLGG